MEFWNKKNIECFRIEDSGIYETEIFGCIIIGWNLYIHQGCPHDLVKKIDSYL